MHEEWQLPFLVRAQVSGTFGVVASSNKLAAAAGMGALERNGNAIDAAVTAGFVFQVVEPHMNGLGGEVVALIKLRNANEPKVICGQGVAPGSATIARYRNNGHTLVPSQGLAAAVVPGAFGAWMLMLREFGTLTLRQVLSPAIGYAESGFVLQPDLQKILLQFAKKFKDHWPTSAASHLRQGEVPSVGDLMVNRALANTFKEILKVAESHSADRDEQIEKARNYFYNGRIAEEIGRFVEKPSVVGDNTDRDKGFLQADDLASWRPTIEEPVSINWRGQQIFKPGFWTQGPVLLQQLQIIGDTAISELDPVGPDFIHLVVEASKLAFSDRERWYGDSCNSPSRRSELLRPEYAKKLRALITDQAAASYSFEDARAEGIDPVALNSNPIEGDTTHMNIADRWGNVVSVTPSGGWMQGSPAIPNRGFCLSTRAQMFWLDERSSSRLEPYTRPRTTLSPTLARAGDNSITAFGSKGADYADQWATQFALHYFLRGVSLQAAMDTPFFGSDHSASSVYPRKAAPFSLVLDPRIPEATAKSLIARGHLVEIAEQHRHGRNCAVSLINGILQGASSLRMANAMAIAR